MNNEESPAMNPCPECKLLGGHAPGCSVAPASTVHSQFRWLVPRFGRLKYLMAASIGGTLAFIYAHKPPEFVIYVPIIFFVLMAYPTFLRLRDIGMSGWWLLLWFVPFANLVVLALCLSLAQMMPVYAKRRRIAIALAVFSLLAGTYICEFSRWWLSEEQIAFYMGGRHAKWVFLASKPNAYHDVNGSFWQPALWFMEKVQGYEYSGRSEYNGPPDYCHQMYLKEIHGETVFDSPATAIRKVYIYTGVLMAIWTYFLCRIAGLQFQFHKRLFNKLSNSVNARSAARKAKQSEQRNSRAGVPVLPPTEQPLSEHEQLLEVGRALDHKLTPKTPRPNEPNA
jgi:uncharacterized membrane protein YhaH (DUF805 family)